MLAELRTRLESELDRLAAEAAVHASPGGDRRETRLDGTNGEQVQRRIRHLGQVMAGLAFVDSKLVSMDRAGFGSRLVLRDLNTGDTLNYTLMAGDFLDITEGHVSLASPLGQALLGRKEGETVQVATPSGTRRYEILSVWTLPQDLGLGSEMDPADGPLQVA